MMKCHADITALALEKFKDAECLLINGRLDTAYYIAGYSVELLIKARVCRTLGIEDFFDFNNPDKTRLKNEGNIYKPFKVHDFEQLLVLSGIYTEFASRLSSDESFKTAWSFLSVWTESARYVTGKTEEEVKKLLISIKRFEVWILKYL